MKYYFYISLILFSNSLIGIDNDSYKINHLEPPLWWAGMLDSSLQLMVHGEDISDLDPDIDYPGVLINGTHKTENPNYLFIDLLLKKDKPKKFTIKFNEAKKTVLKRDYEIFKRQ